tara:strand:+ start:14740 stop:14868 length:129 start_codon:yes stop_codon:yes gene_type:complete
MMMFILGFGLGLIVAGIGLLMILHHTDKSINKGIDVNDYRGH